MEGFRSSMVAVVATAFLLSALTLPAQAALVGTEQLVDASTGISISSRERVDAFLARDEVRQRLQSWGVAPGDAQARVAALSDSEIATLAQHIDQVPAGAGALEVIGIVFVVLLILELVGVTNIFNRI